MFALPYQTEADRNQLSKSLGDISEFEYREHRSMLSAVVVHKPTSSEPRMPGKGFFKLAKKLGAWDGRGSRDSFFSSEIKKVYDYWSNK